MFQQIQQFLLRSVMNGVNERRSPVLGHIVDVSAMIDQDSHRSSAVLVAADFYGVKQCQRIHLGPMRQQNLQRRWVFELCRCGERGARLYARPTPYGSDVWIRAVIE